MTHSPAPLSPLLALAARWRVLGLLAVMFARQVSLAAKMRADGAAEAGLLEAFLYRAILQLSRDITHYSAHAGSLSPEEQTALEYLTSVYTHLMMLVLLIRQMRADFEQAAEAYAALLGQPRRVQCALPAPRAEAVAGLDSS